MGSNYGKFAIIRNKAGINNFKVDVKRYHVQIVFALWAKLFDVHSINDIGVFKQVFLYIMSQSE
jgi:hypothetical protein